MGPQSLFDRLSGDEIVAAQISSIVEFPPREAQLANPTMPMHPRLRERLDHLGLEKLFSHQAEAYDAVSRGDDVVVVTGTNSGKTLCYNLPTLQKCLTEPACKALYMFPTKALAQDQLGKLEMLIPGNEVKCGTYDGDTPPARRAGMRKAAHIILTNPDMLHIGIMPGHENWQRFFKSLRVIVLDEMHVYRGVFGSHVGGIIRRLLRLCEWHHNRPQIVACSATIGNPVEVFEKLTGRRPTLINNDGSPKAKRTFVFWNPPKIDEQRRMSANYVSSEVLTTLCETGLRNLTFCRARISTELVLRYARERLEKSGKLGPEVVESYRAGYTVKERRQIEKALFKGDLLGMVATNAMELGVDVGGLDAVVMNGYPGTISSFWQQAGRAGRGTREGLAILVAHDDPLEQFLIREPHMLLEGVTESVSVNPSNPQILSQQLKCAAYERPLGASELSAFGDNALELVESMDRMGELEFRSGRFYYPSHEPPAPNVNIRGGGGDEIRLMVEGNELGTMERWRAIQHAHPGAVYLHRGLSFVVQSLDLERCEAIVERKDVDYYTQPISQSVIDPQLSLETRAVGSYAAELSAIKVTDLVVGYKVKALDGDAVRGIFDLDLPANTFETLAVRMDLPEMLDGDDPEEAIGGIHGLEHALMAVAPLLAGCDRGDLGSAWYSFFPDTFKPALFIFDRTPGGVGLAEKLFDNLKPLAMAALQMVKSCPCVEGCPACLLSARCEANNEALHKGATIKLLENMLR